MENQINHSIIKRHVISRTQCGAKVVRLGAKHDPSGGWMGLSLEIFWGATNRRGNPRRRYVSRNIN